MAKKILFCASTTSHIKNFHIPYIEAFSNDDYEVFTATGDNEVISDTDGCFSLPFRKRFFSLKNIFAIFAARKLLLHQRFDVISLHTTLASAVVRAALLTIPKRLRPRVFYTCHGYLFGENDGVSSLKYLLPEKLCAKVTDVLMVMNHEDERIARRHRLSNGEICYIDGMGLLPTRFTNPTPQQHLEAKEALGFSPEKFLFVYAAEFSKRKNHRQLISAFADASPAIPQARLLLAGTGELVDECRQLTAQLGIAERVRFLGYVTNTPALLSGCDACVSTNTIKGLPFNIMEALASGLSVLASDIKGHRELSDASPSFELFDTKARLTELIIAAADTPNCRYPADLSRFLLPQALSAIMQIYLGESVDAHSDNLTKVGDS